MTSEWTGTRVDLCPSCAAEFGREVMRAADREQRGSILLEPTVRGLLQGWRESCAENGHQP